MVYVHPLRQFGHAQRLYDAYIVFIFTATGGVLLLLILFKYIKTRRELKKWEVATYVDGRTTWRSFRLSDDEDANGQPRQQTQTLHARGIYDNWLLTRFSVAFVFALIFMLDTILLQLLSHKMNLLEAEAAAPDLRASRAVAQFCTMIPGAFASLLMLFTFGTTKHFRDTIVKTFLPCCCRCRQQHQKGRCNATGVTGKRAGGGGAKGRETPTVGSVETYSSDRALLGLRFGDRGSWMVGVKTSGNSGKSCATVFFHLRSICFW